MGFSGTDHVKIVPGDAGYVLEDSFSMGAPNAYKKITSRRNTGRRRSRAISPRFSFNRFLLALVILSPMIMVAHCQQSCSLEHCTGAATNGCCKDIDRCIKNKGCAGMCGDRKQHHGIGNELISKCYVNGKFEVCKDCSCP